MVNIYINDPPDGYGLRVIKELVRNTDGSIIQHFIADLYVIDRGSSSDIKNTSRTKHCTYDSSIKE